MTYEVVVYEVVVYERIDTGSWRGKGGACVARHHFRPTINPEATSLSGLKLVVYEEVAGGGRQHQAFAANNEALSYLSIRMRAQGSSV